MEARRLEAAELLQRGIRKAKVAERLGVSRTSVSRWARSLDLGQSLVERKAPGRPRRISKENLKSLREWLKLRNGIKTTAGHLQEAIQQQFGVSYDYDHVTRILKELRAQ